MAMGAKSEGGSAGESLRLRFDAFELDEADARLTRDGQPVPLAPRPFAVLCALARTPRTLVTKNALLDTVWGHRFVSDSVLKTTVSALRAALEDDAERAALHRDGVAARLPLHRRRQRAPGAVESVPPPTSTSGCAIDSLRARSSAAPTLSNDCTRRMAARARGQAPDRMDRG